MADGTGGFGLSCTYDVDVDATAVMEGLRVAADALNAGQTARAMIAAVLLKLPELDQDGAIRVARALSKYNPDEPRDWQGRWTDEGSGGADPRAPAADEASELPRPGWVKLPPGERIDELGDLLEWIANAKPKEEREIRAEIKRLFYDVGDVRGGDVIWRRWR